jgi:hypothetical protein
MRLIARSASAIGIWSLVIGHLGIGITSVALAAEVIPIPAALHVHTTFSTGAEDLDGVARRARSAGLKAVLFTENYALRFEYGIEPLAGLLRWREHLPSLGPGDLPRYLEAIRQARARHPDLILLPGLEVIPHYYWTGSLWSGHVTLHDGQKNILILGLEHAEDLAALPLPGTARWPGATGWATGLLALPLAAAGVWFFRRRTARVERWRQYRIRHERRHRLAGTALVALAFLLGANCLLAVTPSWDPHAGPQGHAPHQAVIDAAESRGGISVWSLPEARDLHVHQRAGITVTLRTEPYPQALADTRNYTAFGALYWDTTSLEAPGGLWDRLLLEHVAGLRPRWPAAVAESAFHYHGQAGKALDDAQTVFLVSAPTPAAVLEALRAGRAYAHLRAEEYALLLDGFTVNGTGPGDTASPPPGEPPRIAVALASSDGRPRSAEARLIRNGAVMAERKGPTPLAFTLEDRDAPQAGAWYYRLDVRGEKGARLITNPVFVRGPQ